jgi:hypothetical protein
MDSSRAFTRLTIHALATDDNGLQGRCNLVKDNFQTSLKARSKRLFRLATHDSSSSSSSPSTGDHVGIVQLLMVKPDTLLVSVATSSCNLPLTSVSTTTTTPSATTPSATTKSSPTTKPSPTTPSATTPSATTHIGYGWARPFPWEGGMAGVPLPQASKQPPSRAYQKLDEILAVCGENPLPQTLVVDLGSAPGGWAYRLANDLVCLPSFSPPFPLPTKER